MEWQISDFDTCNFEQIVAAIQRILYAADDSPAVIAEAQAIIYMSSNPSNENDENKARREINKRKLAVCVTWWNCLMSNSSHHML